MTRKPHVYAATVRSEPEDERHAFELWAVGAETFCLIPSSAQVIERMASGKYLYGSVQQGWEAWQARAALGKGGAA